MPANDDRRRRAEQRRAHVVLHKTTLRRTEHDLSSIGGADAISLVSRLTRESWSAAGLPMPEYARAETPYRFVPRRRT